MRDRFVSGWWLVPGAVLGALIWMSAWTYLRGGVLALLALLTLGGCMAAPQPVTRSVDHGGVLRDYMAAVQAEVGGPVRPVSDVCESACTLYLRTRCVRPDTVLRFHGPSSHIYGVGLGPAAFEEQSRLMASYYPPGIRAAFLNEWRYTIIGFVTITGAQAVRLGAKEC